MSGFIAFWPGQASAHAAAVDTLLGAFTVLIVVLSAPVFILLTVFAVRYRRGKPADRAHPMDRNVWLEASWALIPLVLILVFFARSAWLYFDLRTPPAGALEIDVVAKRWMWKVQHPGGQGEIDELHVPAGEPVVLRMISQDVIHSFFLPALRLKQDVLPGRYSTLWFNADRPGTYRLACAEFCGTDHSLMGGVFVVMRPDDYAGWLERSGTDGSLAAQGAALFRSRGCSGCHAAGATVHAPRLEGVFGAPVPLESGRIAVADEGYLRDSILLPQKDIAAGYPRIMPTYANILGEDDLVRLLAYIKSLGSPAAPMRESEAR